MVVDVFQDIACPWCRIGKKNLTDAIARWDGEPIQVRYRAYFLNDQIPSGGYEFKSYMHAKGGGQVALETFFDGPRLRGYGRAPRDYAGGRQARDLLYFEMSVAITPRAFGYKIALTLSCNQLLRLRLQCYTPLTVNSKLIRSHS